MKSQTHSLEKIMADVSESRFSEFRSNLAGHQNIIAVCSGKGGVGKSTFVTNLSIALVLLKKKVLVLDADLGLANLHILFNYKKTQDLGDLFSGKLEMKDIISRTPYGVDLICGGNGKYQLTDLSEEEIWLFLDQIKEFKDYDFILLDLGAGISRSVLTFLRAATQMILITTPEPTSLSDAYGLLKGYKNYVTSGHNFNNYFVVINKSNSEQQSQSAMYRLSETCKRYLDIKITNLGYLPNDDYLVNSVYQRKPLIVINPVCQFIKLIAYMSKNIIIRANQSVPHSSIRKESSDMEGLIKSLIT